MRAVGQDEDLEPAVVDHDRAAEFIRDFFAEQPVEHAAALKRRLARVHSEIDRTGTYRHTSQELTHGARVAWRNSARCIGRLYWQSLRVRDRRALRSPASIARECAEHLRDTTRGGHIRPTITVFAPDRPGRPGPIVHNDQLIRYAGYRRPSGQVLGDPSQVDFTDRARRLGWRPPRQPGRFDLLPLVIECGGSVRWFALPRAAVLEVALEHPDYPWFADLGLRWHAVPAISNMPLEIGGVVYPSAPFNGWYMGTEIGVRNLGDTDRYDQVPVVAERMGLDTSTDSTLWRDRAVVELTVAVHHSFERAGVRMSDHHTESRRFLDHLTREAEAGRPCPADWTWIVPPISGAQTPVFHRYYDQPESVSGPSFQPARSRRPVVAELSAVPVSRCPVAASRAN